jgi:hypothetical protein
MSMVWKHAPYDGCTLLTLLALADWADEEGSCFPSIKQLAVKSRQSERNAQRCIRRIANDSFLFVRDPGGGRLPGSTIGKRPLYRINIDKLSPTKKLSKGDKLDTTRVTEMSSKGDKCGCTIRNNRHYEPSENNHQKRGRLSPAERDSWDLRRYTQELQRIQEIQRGSGATFEEQSKVAAFRAGVTPERLAELTEKCFGQKANK